MHSTKYRTTPWPTRRMPPGIPYIIGNEAAERFSYYGMSGILFAFLTEHLRNQSGAAAPLSPEEAKAWTHYFIAAVYALPLAGAVLSDWLLGKYVTIVTISLLYCAGHAVLALVDFPAITGIEPKLLLGFGLALIALGSGGIKPCVSAHVGDQFGKQNEHLIPTVFGWFYFSINVGSVASMLLTPWLLKHYGPGWAFGVPGILMGVATLVFWLGRNRYVHIPPGGNAFFRETFSYAGVRAIVNLIPLYLFIFPFFMLFDQTHSAWVEQAKSMNGDFLLFSILPAQLQAVNPALILIFIPTFSYGVYPLLGRWFEVTPLRKIGIGLFLAAASFVIIALAQHRIDVGARPHMLWQVLAYAVLTAAEVMVSITALEFSYTQAPKKMKSLIMGVYLLVAIAVGNIVTAQVNEYLDAQRKAGSDVLEGANYYWFFAGIMFAAAVVFVLWSQFYRGQVYIQGEE
ncbi:MAG: POT family MFS transporter [Pirellulales bacterium]|nr:POT family MFS transporter [Pirellulales bacterium]